MCSVYVVFCSGPLAEPKIVCFCTSSCIFVQKLLILHTYYF